MGSPRVDVVFRRWQRDKENHGWREGPPMTVPCQVSICWPGLHPPAKSVSNEKRIPLRGGDREPGQSRHWSVNFGNPEVETAKTVIAERTSKRLFSAKFP